MLNLINGVALIFRRTLPSPFSIAIILTFTTIFLALILTESNFITILNSWEEGLWNPKLMTFTTQMILMLVLGYVIGLTPFANNIISKITGLCSSNSKSAA